MPPTPAGLAVTKAAENFPPPPHMHPHIGTAVLLAFCAAVSVSLAASIQHRVASNAPKHVCHGAVSTMKYLLTRPAWLIGIPVSLLGMGLHATALKYGPLTSVQPVMVTAVILAVIIRTGFEKRLIKIRELFGVAITATGLGVFLLLAHPSGTVTFARQDRAFTTAGILLLLVFLGLGWMRYRTVGASLEAYFLAVTAGLCFGLLDCLMKVTVDSFAAGDNHLIDKWPVLGMIICGILGVTINQRAYHVAPIAVAMPVVNIINILVAVGFSWVVFSQPSSTSLAGMLVQAACLIVAGYGLRRIAMETGHGMQTTADVSTFEETVLTMDTTSVARVSEPVKV